jgi:hypothetical protein
MSQTTKIITMIFLILNVVSIHSVPVEDNTNEASSGDNAQNTNEESDYLEDIEISDNVVATSVDNSLLLYPHCGVGLLYKQPDKDSKDYNVFRSWKIGGMFGFNIPIKLSHFFSSFELNIDNATYNWTKYHELYDVKCLKKSTQRKLLDGIDSYCKSTRFCLWNIGLFANIGYKVDVMDYIRNFFARLGIGIIYQYGGSLEYTTDRDNSSTNICVSGKKHIPLRTISFLAKVDIGFWRIGIVYMQNIAPLFSIDAMKKDEDHMKYKDLLPCSVSLYFNFL